ncbi:MAG: c-type cytochrome [Gammaproteobacteria bacterium]|nr:c-type cytochrome [Gammaproteobacteria bacterium]
MVVPSDDGLNPRQMAKADKNTTPVGEVRLEGEALPAEEPAEEMLAAAEETAMGAGAETADPGKQVYSSLCFSCHGTGLPGIPQLGDKSAWAERVAKGTDTLYANAINGYVGSSGIPMPAKGGNTALSDDEVKAAVDYMVSSAE